MDVDWKTVGWLAVLALLLSVAIGLIAPNASAFGIIQNNTVDENASYYVQQGDTVYVGDHLDISGVILPYPYLAYWDGFDMYDANPSYNITIPLQRKAITNFYVDPEVFSTRLGRWYKYDGVYEPNSNNMVFVVVPKRNVTGLINQGQNSTNITLQNPNQTPIVFPIIPLLPVRHVSDYLVARGDNFSISGNVTTNLWVFGARDAIYGFKSSNNTMNLTRDVIYDLSPGKYTLLLQMPRNDTNDFMIRYNPDNSNIEWFDSESFVVNRWDTLGQTPENVLNKLESIFPMTRDTYMMFNLEVQDPTISIDRIDVMNALNDTSNDATISLTPASYLDVRGYTNVATDSIIQVVVDPVFNVSEDVTWKNAIVTSAQGTVGGDMREFKVIIPVDLYNLPMGRHFVGARTLVGDSVTTADFQIYGTPTGNFVPNKTIRYISGLYGPEELVPTPTPVIVEKIVTQIVTQVVTVEVTPSNEQVKAQQDVVTKEREMYWITVGGGGLVILLGMFFLIRFVFRAYKRRGWMQK
jgi:hypothetical protein